MVAGREVVGVPAARRPPGARTAAVRQDCAAALALLCGGPPLADEHLFLHPGTSPSGG